MIVVLRIPCFVIPANPAKDFHTSLGVIFPPLVRMADGRFNGPTTIAFASE